MIKRKKGAASFGAEQKHTKINNIKIPLYHIVIVRRYFLVEILTNFDFYVCFLATF